MRFVVIRCRVILGVEIDLTDSEELKGHAMIVHLTEYMIVLTNCLLAHVTIRATQASDPHFHYLHAPHLRMPSIRFRRVATG